MKDNLSDKAVDTLDEISMLRLELMDELITHKKELESFLREGYFMLGKSRYIMGVNSVSILQVPSDDCNVSSLISSHASEEFFSELPSFKHYQYSIVPSPKKIEPAKEDEEETAKLRKRGTLDESPNSSNEDVKEVASSNTNPIYWFSGLPPQSLRQAQEYFKKALLKSAECATIQSKLNALNIEAKATS